MECLGDKERRQVRAGQEDKRKEKRTESNGSLEFHSFLSLVLSLSTDCKEPFL